MGSNETPPPWVKQLAQYQHEQARKEWTKPGEIILVSKIYMPTDEVDVSWHHRSCALRNGTRICTC